MSSKTSWWRTSVVLLSVACLPEPLVAQAAAPAPALARAAPATSPFVKADAEAAVRTLATKLEENFVFPEVGRQYAAILRANLAAGKYSDFPDAEAFAGALTNDMQAVHKDGHLHVDAPLPEELHGAIVERGPVADGQNAISRSGWIADGVAYIDFDGFPGDKATLETLGKFIAEHKSAKTLIIDARNHHGGGLAEMNLLFPQLFAKETVLVDMDTRASVSRQGANPFDEDSFVRSIAGPESVVRQEHYVVPAKDQGALASAKVYLLVSHVTGSAGEHLALALKRTHRATLIGETTHGMGHYGGFEKLGGGYTAFIPVGRTFDPDTGEGWEGVGVKPDIAVPADQALDEALKRAGVKASARIALANLR